MSEKFKVTWSYAVTVGAITPWNAALIAQEGHRRDGATATVFTVVDEHGVRHSADLDAGTCKPTPKEALPAGLQTWGRVTDEQITQALCAQHGGVNIARHGGARYVRSESERDVFVFYATEEPMAGADHVGGDVQASGTWSARLVWSSAERYIVRTAYAYAVGCDEQGARLAVDVDVTPHHYEVDVMLAEVLCTDPEDPGSSEITSDITYPSPSGADASAHHATADEAMAAGRHAIRAWIDEKPTTIP